MDKGLDLEGSCVGFILPYRPTLQWDSIRRQARAARDNTDVEAQCARDL